MYSSAPPDPNMGNLWNKSSANGIEWYLPRNIIILANGRQPWMCPVDFYPAAVGILFHLSELTIKLASREWRLVEKVEWIFENIITEKIEEIKWTRPADYIHSLLAANSALGRCELSSAFVALRSPLISIIIRGSILLRKNSWIILWNVRIVLMETHGDWAARLQRVLVLALSMNMICPLITRSDAPDSSIISNICESFLQFVLLCRRCCCIFIYYYCLREMLIIH